MVSKALAIYFTCFFPVLASFHCSGCTVYFSQSMVVLQNGLK